MLHAICLCRLRARIGSVQLELSANAGVGRLHMFLTHFQKNENFETVRIKICPYNSFLLQFASEDANFSAAVVSGL